MPTEEVSIERQVHRMDMAGPDEGLRYHGRRVRKCKGSLLHERREHGDLPRGRERRLMAIVVAWDQLQAGAQAGAPLGDPRLGRRFDGAVDEVSEHPNGPRSGRGDEAVEAGEVVVKLARREREAFGAEVVALAKVDVGYREHAVPEKRPVREEQDRFAGNSQRQTQRRTLQRHRDALRGTFDERLGTAHRPGYLDSCPPFRNAARVMPLDSQHPPRGAEIQPAADRDNAQNSALDGAPTGPNASKHSCVLRFRGHDATVASL